MSNFHHPRALIDVKSGDDQSDSELAGQISELDLDDKTIDKEKNIDTILLEIEKMYQVGFHYFLQMVLKSARQNIFPKKVPKNYIKWSNKT